jgi:hypothetical protein
MAAGEIFIQLVVDRSDDEQVRALARYGRHARGCRDLYTEMLLYCRRKLTDGHVPTEQIGILVYPDPPKAGLADADRLIAVGLAERTPTGYFVPGYLKRNPSRAEVEASMAAKVAGAAAANHQRWHLARRRRDPTCALCTSLAADTRQDEPGVAPAIDGAIGGAIVVANPPESAETETETETETERTTRPRLRAAAARNVRPCDQQPPPPQHPELQPLRDALDAAHLTVRWDKLGSHQRADIAHLIELHGIPALLAVAQANYRPDNPPAYAQAWLGAWQAIPPPRPRAKPRPCTVHIGQSLPCRYCAADQKAAS